MGLGDEQHRATTALINELWGGGPVHGATGLESVMTDAGLSAVRILPSPPSLTLVAGQRA